MILPYKVFFALRRRDPAPKHVNIYPCLHQESNCNDFSGKMALNNEFYWQITVFYFDSGDYA